MMTFREKVELQLEQLRDDFWLFVAYVADRIEREKYESDYVDTSDQFYDYPGADIMDDVPDVDNDFDHPHADHNHSYTEFDDVTTEFNSHQTDYY